jgi:hypothetical protein
MAIIRTSPETLAMLKNAQMRDTEKIAALKEKTRAMAAKPYNPSAAKVWPPVMKDDGTSLN